MRKLLPLLALPLLLAGCRNSCQQLCVEIRDFARSECDLEFPDAEFDACIDAYAGVDKLQKQQCSDGVGQVSEEWDCDQVEIYFEGEVGGDGGGGDTGTSSVD